MERDRSRAGSFPILEYRLRQLEAEVERLKSERRGNSIMIKKYKVTGYALIPVQIEMNVEIDSKSGVSDRHAAKQKAAIYWQENPNHDRQDLIVPGSEDEGAVHEFIPSEAVEVFE